MFCLFVNALLNGMSPREIHVHIFKQISLYPCTMTVVHSEFPNHTRSVMVGALPVSRYLQNHLNNLFAGAWEPRDTTPLPVSVPQASSSQSELPLPACWNIFHTSFFFFSMSVLQASFSQSRLQLPACWKVFLCNFFNLLCS